MAKINVTQSHSLPVETARTRAVEIFESYKSKFGVNSRWEGNTLVLSGSGFDGQALITDGKIDVNVNLGLAASLFKGQVESTLKSELEKKFRA